MISLILNRPLIHSCNCRSVSSSMHTVHRWTTVIVASLNQNEDDSRDGRRNSTLHNKLLIDLPNSAFLICYQVQKQNKCYPLLFS